MTKLIKNTAITNSLDTLAEFQAAILEVLGDTNARGAAIVLTDGVTYKSFQFNMDTSDLQVASMLFLQHSDMGDTIQ